MGRRLDLQTILKGLCDNVYFQPPDGLQMTYPAIVYHRDYADTMFADNNPYKFTKRYMVTVIDRDPDSEIPDKIAALPMCMFNRFFAVGDLNHDVFRLYF